MFVDSNALVRNADFKIGKPAALFAPPRKGAENVISRYNSKVLY
jgi:hypothetical protein